MDGASTDGTVDILKKYSDRIDILISEPDKGIYNAMNKGIKLATGEYTIFMNGGDELYEKTTLEKVFMNNNPKDDIVYGDIYLKDKEITLKDIINRTDFYIKILNSRTKTTKFLKYTHI